jgi:hypothetical protein
MRFRERPDRMSEGTALYVTERLLMRPLTREQAERVVAEDRTGQAWSVGYPRTDDRDVARMFLAQDNCHDPRFGPLQIVLRDTGHVVVRVCHRRARSRTSPGALTVTSGANVALRQRPATAAAWRCARLLGTPRS